MNQGTLMLNTLMPLSILATENHGHFTNLSNGNGNGGNNMTNNMTNGGNNMSNNMLRRNLPVISGGTCP